MSPETPVKSFALSVLISLLGAGHAQDPFEVFIPAGTTLCQAFNKSASIEEAYQSLAQIELVSGTVELLKSTDEFETDLIDRILIGPQQRVALPQGKGRFTHSLQHGTHYYQFRQDFSVEGLDLHFQASNFSFKDGDPPLVLDDAFLDTDFFMFATLSDGRTLEFSTCTLRNNEFALVDVELEGNRRVVFHERWRFGLIHAANASALVYAEAWLPGEHVRQSKYWRLVNISGQGALSEFVVGETLWLLFDSPVKTAHGIEFSRDGTTYSARLLNSSLETLQPLDVLSYELKHLPKHIFVNEFMADNVSAVSDESGDFDPWIEIHNIASVSEEIGGSYLSNDAEDTLNWQIPQGTEIGPQGYVVIWADGEPSEGLLHTPFYLNPSGGDIFFSMKPTIGSLLVEERIPYLAQSPDVSQGRLPNGLGDMATLESFSPGASNERPSPPPSPTPCPTRNFDVEPTEAPDGRIDARDLLWLLGAIQDGNGEEGLLFDFSTCWKHVSGL